MHSFTRTKSVYNLIMKLPVFEELDITSLREPHALKAKLIHSNVGKCPIYIPATALTKNELIEFIEALDQAMKEMDISLKFPYPLYVIAEAPYKGINTEINFIKSIEALPKFYFKKLRRPRNKENTIMAKLQMLSEKISSIKVDNKTKRILHEFSLQDQIYLKCLELEHIEKIEQKLRERKR